MPVSLSADCLRRPALVVLAVTLTLTAGCGADNEDSGVPSAGPATSVATPPSGAGTPRAGSTATAADRKVCAHLASGADLRPSERAAWFQTFRQLRADNAEVEKRRLEVLKVNQDELAGRLDFGDAAEGGFEAGRALQVACQAAGAL